MRHMARSLIARWADRGSVELLSEFAGQYVGKVLVQVVFNDMDPGELERADDIAVRISEHPTAATFAELGRLSADYLARVRERGTAGDGVVARLLAAASDGLPVSEEQQIGVLSILILGGLDTTRAAIGNIAYRVTQTPGLEDRLREPGWLKRNLDEFLRLDSPVGGNARVAVRDVDLYGARISAGERVQLRFDSANRDETQFKHADRLMFDEPRGGNAAFGLGVHRCIGSNLARLQIETAYDELLKAVANLRLAPDAVITWPPGMTNALRAVNLEFDPVTG